MLFRSVPGFFIAFILMAYSWVYCRVNGENKKAIQKVVDELHRKSFWKVMGDSIWALITPVIILGCIYTGVTSPTEAAAIAVFYSLVISLFIYKTLKINEMWGICVEVYELMPPLCLSWLHR